MMHNKFKDIWHEYYLNQTGEEYYWTAKDAGQVKHLKNKIVFKLKAKNLPTDDDKIVQSFELLLSRITDKWILENLSLALVNSKFNEIIQKGKNGTTQQELYTAVLRANAGTQAGNPDSTQGQPNQ